MLLALLLAAAAVPAEPVVMTRAEAKRMSPAELAEKLLPDFPHAPVRTAKVDQPIFPDQLNLNHVAFEEMGKAVEGRFCGSRLIFVTFDALDGKVPSALEVRQDLPRRRFRVEATPPRYAVLDQEATDARCATVTDFAYMFFSENRREAGFRLVAKMFDLVAQLRQKRRTNIPMTCVDEIDHAACNGPATLAALNWNTLYRAEEWTDGSIGMTLESFTWNVRVYGTDRVEKIVMTRRVPPPF